MPIDPDKNSSAPGDAEARKTETINKKGFRFPWWAGVAVFVVFGGYAGIKQFIEDSPKAAPATGAAAKKGEGLPIPEVPKSRSVNAGSGPDSSVRHYAEQLAVANKVSISGEPRYDLQHPLQLVLYSTSEGSRIACSLKRVECFYSNKRTDGSNSGDQPGVK